MKIHQAISYAGGTQIALAVLLKLTQPAVANWVKRGRIPRLQQYRLEEISGGKLKVDRGVMSGKLSRQ